MGDQSRGSPKWTLKIVRAIQLQNRKPKVREIISRVKQDLFKVSPVKEEEEEMYIQTGEGSLDKIISWDGKKDKSTVIEPGKYKAYLIGTDPAGNSNISTPVFLTVSLTPTVHEPPIKRPVSPSPRNDTVTKEPTSRKSEPTTVQPLRNTIYFDFNRSELRIVGRRVLEQVARTLTMFPDKKIVIHGYYATEESIKIAGDRVTAVKTVLVRELDVAESRLSQPKYTQGTGELGRRVTIEFK